jgi:hypothetical protein
MADTGGESLTIQLPERLSEALDWERDLGEKVRSAKILKELQNAFAPIPSIATPCPN